MFLRAWGSDSGRKRALGCCLTMGWTVGIWNDRAVCSAAKLRAGSVPDVRGESAQSGGVGAMQYEWALIKPLVGA